MASKCIFKMQHLHSSVLLTTTLLLETRFNLVDSKTGRQLTYTFGKTKLYYLTFLMHRTLSKVAMIIETKFTAIISRDWKRWWHPTCLFESEWNFYCRNLILIALTKEKIRSVYLCSCVRFLIKLHIIQNRKFPMWQ